MMKARMVLSAHLPLFYCYYLWYDLPGLLPTTAHAYINHVLRVRNDSGIDILGVQTMASNKTVRGCLPDLLPLTVSDQVT